MHLCGLSYAGRRKRDKNHFTEAREERKGKDRLLSCSVLSRVFAFFAVFCSVFIQKQKNGSCSATSLIEEQFEDNHKVKLGETKAFGDNHGCPQLFCRGDFNGPVELGCLGTNAKSEQQISRFQ